MYIWWDIIHHDMVRYSYIFLYKYICKFIIKYLHNFECFLLTYLFRWQFACFAFHQFLAKFAILKWLVLCVCVCLCLKFRFHIHSIIIKYSRYIQQSQYLHFCLVSVLLTSFVNCFHNFPFKYILYNNMYVYEVYIIFP